MNTSQTLACGGCAPLEACSTCAGGVDFQSVFGLDACPYSQPNNNSPQALFVLNGSSPATIWLLASGLAYSTDLRTDPNGDGVSLLMAYALNLDPRQNLCASLPRPVCAGNQLCLTFLCRE